MFGTKQNGSNFPGFISNAFALIKILLFRFDFLSNQQELSADSGFSLVPKYC